VALSLAAGMLDQPPRSIGGLPLAARLKAGATAVSAPGRPTGLVLDDGKLWVVGTPSAAQLNSSPVTTVSDQQWDAYPSGSDLSTLRP
jgi:hypothetical protein